MALLCVGYVILVGLLLGIAGLLVERALPVHAPRRSIWCAVIAGNLLVPAIYSSAHTVAVGGGHVHGGSAITPAWLPGAQFDRTFEVAWLGVSAFLALWFVAHALRVMRMLRASRGTRLVDGVPVLVTDSGGPATVGVFRALVLLPRWVLAMPARQRQYVVRHEDEHRRSHDARMLFLASLPLILVPWNLPLWWHLRRLRLAVELDCDRRVVRALGDVPAYASMLLKVAEAGQRGPHLQPALLGRGPLERRVRALVAPATVRPGLRLVMPLAAALLLAVVLWAPHPVPPAAAPSPSGPPTLVSR